MEPFHPDRSTGAHVTDETGHLRQRTKTGAEEVGWDFKVDGFGGTGGRGGGRVTTRESEIPFPHSKGPWSKGESEGVLQTGLRALLPLIILRPTNRVFNSETKGARGQRD